ncbi:MAG TPA: nucleotide exchange factor GrpE [Candidatus Nanoarchaeia archaeon]|nr:nucleotide exchange factor GrpE [Candidatus Nanoarchaeia archaeon]
MSKEQKQSSYAKASEDKEEVQENVKSKDESADEKILRLENELKDANDKYLRALAEQQNLVKRQAAEKEDFVRYANQEVISEFLMVYDHLKLSLVHADEQIKKSAWAQGVEYTVKQFKDLLAVNGVEEIKTVGEKFDPSTMEAVEGTGEKVAKEIMPGYKLNGKVIRAARVVLG